MTNLNNVAAQIVAEHDDALGIDPAAFDDAAMDLLFSDFPVLDDDAAYEDALLAEAGVYDMDPTGGAPSPW